MEDDKKSTTTNTSTKKDKEGAPTDDVQSETLQPSTSLGADLASSKKSTAPSSMSSNADDQKILDESISKGEEISPISSKRKNVDTFVYAKHKFVGAKTDFKCKICNVSFTALSSLTRHYLTIYHKKTKITALKQNNDGEEMKDTKQELKEDKDSVGDKLPTNQPNSTQLPNGPAVSSRRSEHVQHTHNSDNVEAPGVIGKRRTPTAATTRQNAVGRIKKFYAAADAGRKKNVSRTNTKRQQTKVDRKRKSVKLQKRDTDSDAEECTSTESKIDDVETEDDSLKPKWLSNVWKGIGPPHFTCEVCGVEYSKKREFTEHLFKHRCEEQEEMERLRQENKSGLDNSETENDRRKFQCPKCRCAFSKEWYLFVHIKSHDRPCPYTL